MVTPSGIEPELPPWKGGVLTAWPWSLNKNRQRPTFPGSFPPSIISAKELNYCVRDGNRCDLLAIVTGFSACGFSIWLCCCSHPAVLMYLCTLRSSVLARLVSCKISCAVSCLLNSPITSLLLVLCVTHILLYVPFLETRATCAMRIFLRNFSAFELLLSQNLLRSFNILYPEN